MGRYLETVVQQVAVAGQQGELAVVVAGAVVVWHE